MHTFVCIQKKPLRFNRFLLLEWVCYTDGHFSYFAGSCLSSSKISRNYVLLCLRTGICLFKLCLVFLKHDIVFSGRTSLPVVGGSTLNIDTNFGIDIDRYQCNYNTLVLVSLLYKLLRFHQRGILSVCVSPFLSQGRNRWTLLLLPTLVFGCCTVMWLSSTRQTSKQASKQAQTSQARPAAHTSGTKI